MRMTGTETPIPLEVFNSSPTLFPVATGGSLRIGVGTVNCRYRVSFKHRDDQEAIDTLAFLTRLVDQVGDEWESEVICRPKRLIGKLLDFGRDGAPLLFSSAPEDWKGAFDESMVLAGARELLDDRTGRVLWIEGTRYLVQFKYQGPIVDIAVLDSNPASSDSLLLRVSGLYGWLNEPTAAADDGDNDDDDYVEIPPLVCRCSAAEFLFITFGYLEDETFWEENSLPLPVYFRRTGLKGGRQETVVLDLGT